MVSGLIVFVITQNGNENRVGRGIISAQVRKPGFARGFCISFRKRFASIVLELLTFEVEKH